MKKYLILLMMLLVLGFAGCFEEQKKNTEKTLTKIVLTSNKTAVVADGEDAVILTVKGYDKNDDEINAEIILYNNGSETNGMTFSTSYASIYNFEAKANNVISNQIKIEAKHQKSAQVEEYINSLNFDGSIIVKDNKGIIIKKGYGFADAAQKLPNKTDTKYIIASLSKQFASLCIMKLVDENKLSVDDYITKYLDYPNAQNVKIHHLLSHSSGITDYVDSSGIDFTRNYSPEELMNIIKDEKLKFTPGSTFNYSNSNYMLLGIIIEKISGLSYSEYLDKNIFKPLGMVNSGYKTDFYSQAGSAKGYINILNNQKAADNIMTIPYSAGGISSTIEDFEKWDEALYTERLISEKSKKIMFTRQNFNYGYGWFISGDGKKVSHAGYIPGFKAHVIRDLEKKQLVVVLSNNEYHNVDNITGKIISLIN